MKPLRTMSVWSVAIGLELGAESLGLRRQVRFYCLDCLPRMDPAGSADVLDTPWARECMACTGPREPVVMVTRDAPAPIR